jgi:hypothetical protein
VLEANVLQHSPRWLADEREELALQAARRRAGDAREFPDGPTVTDIGMHRIERATNRTRHRRCMAASFQNFAIFPHFEAAEPAKSSISG